MVLLLFSLFIFLVFRTTTHEKSDQLFSNRKVIFTLFLRLHFPVEFLIVGFYLFQKFIFLDWLAVVEVFESVCKTKVHLALRTFEVLYISKLSFTPLALAMSSSAIRPRLLVSLVLFELAFTCLDMLIPNMPRRYTKFGLPFETQN